MKHTGEMQDQVGFHFRKYNLSLNYRLKLIKLSTGAGFIMRTWDCINSGPSYRFICETNEIYEDIANLLLQRRWPRFHDSKQTTDSYFLL